MTFPFSCRLDDDGSSPTETFTTANVHTDRIEISGGCDATIYLKKAGNNRCIIVGEEKVQSGSSLQELMIGEGNRFYVYDSEKLSHLFVGQTYDQIEEMLFRKHIKEFEGKLFKVQFAVFLVGVAVIIAANLS